ncbi:MAG: FAD-binding protein, partial [Gordonibacter sp.]
NTKSQVIDTEGEAISHLYAAGQVAGGFMGSYYPGTGTGILATLAFGRSAAENALNESEA